MEHVSECAHAFAWLIIIIASLSELAAWTLSLVVALNVDADADADVDADVDAAL